MLSICFHDVLFNRFAHPAGPSEPRFFDSSSLGFMYWLLPGHYILEGLMTTQFHEDNSPISASPGSGFFLYLGCTEGSECVGTADEWVTYTFAGEFSFSNVPYDILYLVVMTILTRVITVWALSNLNYRST